MVDVIDFNDVFFDTTLDLYAKRSQEKIKRSKRRRDNRVAKSRLRHMTIGDPKFFAQSKQEQRDQVKRSPYSLKRLKSNHQDKIFASVDKAERIAKATKTEMIKIQKKYLGKYDHENDVEENNKSSDGKVMKKDMEFFAQVLAEIAYDQNVTAEGLMKDPDALMFFTSVYMPADFKLVCEYIDNEKSA